MTEQTIASAADAADVDTRQGVTPDAPMAGTDVTAESSTAETADVTSEESSPSQEDVGSRKTLLDVAREVLAQPRPAESSESQASSAEESSQPEGPADSPTDTTASQDTDATVDDFKDAETLPFGKHPRFKKLLQQWHADQEPARQYRQVQSFLAENGVPPDMAAEGLKQAALLQHARRGSVEHARLLLQDLDKSANEIRELLGEAIPEDLRQKLDTGLVDEDSARELAQARSKLSIAERERKREREDASASVRQAAAQAAQVAVHTWESQVRSRDPDYEKKSPLVLRTVRALAAERGAPKTAEDAVKLAQAAYDEVNTYLKDLRPAPRQTPTAVPRAHGGGLPSRPQPKSLLEVVRNAAAGNRAS